MNHSLKWLNDTQLVTQNDVSVGFLEMCLQVMSIHSTVSCNLYKLPSTSEAMATRVIPHPSLVQSDA